LNISLPILQEAGRRGYALDFAPVVMPMARPGVGEQYRFHFDMSKCIGCKCCVVACNEQNGNPAEMNWRRVGEIEGGIYPQVQRWHLSMGCNHCVEPSCMIGCPVEAYSKDAATGIVDHNPDQCIGCQYCTWNCSYGVPQYNEARGVVGKCDLCHSRLNDGDTPACADACPEGAIAIEIVNITDWTRQHAAANAPGMPSADNSISTTRITLPTGMTPDVKRVDRDRVEPEHPHWPLVFMLTGIPCAVGAWLLLGLAGQESSLLLRAALFALVAISLSGSLLHLGRPAFAWRAVLGWRTSWLSREAIAFTLFAGLAQVAVFLPQLALPAGLLGLVGLLVSARIYRIAARPAWHSWRTDGEFVAAALFLGGLLTAALGIPLGAMAAVAGGVAQVGLFLSKLFWLRGSAVEELQLSGAFFTGRFRLLAMARVALVGIALLLPPVAGVAFAIAAELLGRWLFFVTVVPESIASTYLKPKGAAA
jgi:formate dehydrogenase iron-sulfur subunit